MFSESNGDSTAQRTPIRTHPQDGRAVAGPRLQVQQIAGVEDRLRTHRQTERGQVLRDLDAERGIVNREPSRGWIDRKHGRIR